MPTASARRRRTKRKGRARGGPWRRVNIAGRRFGDLFALRPHSYVPGLGWIWEMECRCLRDCRHHKGRVCLRVRFVLAKMRYMTTSCAKCSGKGRDVHHYEQARQTRKPGRPHSQVTVKNFRRLIDGFSESERVLFDCYMGNRTRDGERGKRNMISCCELVLMDRRKAGN